MRARHEPERRDEREAMVRQIVAHVRDTATWLGMGSLSTRVLDALHEVPRHEFVPAELGSRAYADAALPIAQGQTISQPYIVAVSSELAAVRSGAVVLDVGTGCGYQAAVLARLARRVHSIELIPELARRAAATLARLGIDNVEVRTGDGWHGWPEHAPYDAIVVAAAAGEVPPALLEQLAPGSRMVIPVDAGELAHHLLVVEKDAGGVAHTRKTVPVAFVPLRRASASDA